MKLLLAWELGAGLGHMTSLASFTAYFTSQQCEVAYALRDVDTAKSFHKENEHKIYQAPVLGIRRANRGAAYDCADMLLIRDYEDLSYLKNAIDKWLDIFAEFQPDAIVTDHAPSARLAAHVAGIKSHAIGNGFSIPPITLPLQTLQVIPQPDVNLISDNEKRLNNCINKLLREYQLPEIKRAVEIFYGGSTFIRAFKELDHYSLRDDSTFYGVPLDEMNGIEPIWPNYSKKKAFVYFYPDDPILPRLLSVLHKLKIDTLFYANIDEELLPFTINSKHIEFSSKPFDISDIAGKCDLVICRGTNTVARSLLQGIPLLTFPTHIEQQINSLRLVQQQLGDTLNQDADENAIANAINHCLNDNRIKQATTNFATKYKEHNHQQAIVNIAQQILNSFS
jgi:UDP-N-acetylglucosamine:LPS N-acetylglucosamine transferase